MPTTHISLNEGWTFWWSGYGGDHARPPETVPGNARPAQVPGVAQMDLMREGLLPDLYVGDNLDHALWMEQKDWWYAREFPTPPGLQSQRARLVFHGLDTFATVWLNGKELGRTDNMFIRHEFDVTPLLAANGLNRLVVRLAAPTWSAHFDRQHAPLYHTPERLFCRKPQMSYGWDIAPRLVTIGIWRPVELVLVDTARLRHVWVRPLRFEGADVVAQVQTVIDWFGAADQPAAVSGHVHQTAWQARGLLKPGANVLTTEVVIKAAPRWWPIGYGNPEIVDVEAALESAGKVLDRFSGQAGLRRIELVREPQPSGAESFRFRCNGRDIFITGLNWTPLDALFPKVTPERITRTLESLAGIGCNMLRIWGGGIYESPHFYRECSRLGILVWQDFMMACGRFPQTDTFAAALAAEARQVVSDLRGYPCLAMWAGDNECDAMYPHLGASNRLTRQVLPDVCRELDPDTPYVPSSPWSPSGQRHPGAAEEGDAHHWNHGSGYRDPLNWNLRCRFLSEFGHLSLPSLDVIRRYFPAGTEWPLTTAAWKYHGADTTREGFFRGAECIVRSLKACGPDCRTIEEAVHASQDLQAEAVCAWITRYCEDPEFAGFLLWNVGDCWPQQSDSVLDYLGRPKAVFARLGPLFAALQESRRQAPGGQRNAQSGAG